MLAKARSYPRSIDIIILSSEVMQKKGPWVFGEEVQGRQKGFIQFLSLSENVFSELLVRSNMVQAMLV